MPSILAKKQVITIPKIIHEVAKLVQEGEFLHITFPVTLTIRLPKNVSVTYSEFDPSIPGKELVASIPFLIKKRVLFWDINMSQIFNIVYTPCTGFLRFILSNKPLR